MAQWLYHNPSSTPPPPPPPPPPHTHTHSIYLSLRDCISYTGTQCSEVLHADWKVFLSNTSINLEDHLSQVIQLSGQFSEKCRVFVKSALCHTLLPYCDPFTVDEGRYSPLPMCPQSCVQLEERCGREIREFGADFAKFLAARCDKDVDVGGPGDKPGCIFIDPDYPLKGDLTTLTHSPNSPSSHPHRWSWCRRSTARLRWARVYTRQWPQLPWPHKDDSGWAGVPALGCAVPQPAPDAEDGWRGAGWGVEVLQKSRRARGEAVVLREQFQ